MKKNEMVIRADARAMGAVTAVDTRVSARWTPTPPSQRFTDTVMDGVNVPAAVRGSIVKVTKIDGTVEYRTAGSFRAKHVSKRSAIHRTTQQASHRITAADLAPIGNVE